MCVLSSPLPAVSVGTVQNMEYGAAPEAVGTCKKAHRPESQVGYAPMAGGPPLVIGGATVCGTLRKAT